MRRKREQHVRELEYRDPRGYSYAEVDIDLLVPDPENPRIPLQESALETVLELFREDPNGLYALAKDVVAMRGTNPAELINVTRAGGFFVVKEGNRRLAVRRLLRNVEQLRGHVSEAEMQRWTALARSESAKRLPTTALVVIGDDHDPWVDRRHLGPQGGVGVVPWKPQAKARHAERRRGTRDRSLALLDAIAGDYPDRFRPLLPPPRTFTTFTRVMDTPEARAHIGIDVDEQGKVVLTRGERSLRMVEELLRDLRKQGDEKLTSRKIHAKEQIMRHLANIDERVDEELDENAITLTGERQPAAARRVDAGHSRPRPRNPLRSLNTPSAHRLRAIYGELFALRRADARNSAMVMLRVLLELSVDQYAVEKKLPFAGDVNPDLETEIAGFYKALSLAKVEPSRAIREMLRFRGSQPLPFGAKLDLVVQHLISSGALTRREGEAKRRELRQREIVTVLNDAVHRLENVPSMARVDHVVDVLRPVFNAMHPTA